MRINITARHFKLSDELKAYAEQEVYRLKKYYDPIIDCGIILSWQKKLRLAEITIAVHGTILTAREQTDDIDKSISRAVDKLEKQLKKYKGRVRGFNHDTVDKHTPAEESEADG